MQNIKKYKTRTTLKLEGPLSGVELTIGANHSFYDTLLEAIDEAFSSLGESVKTAIYFHLENSMGIRRQEVPFRIDDFQNALEKIFGSGARLLEILFVRNLHQKIKTTYKWNMPRWVVPELTFQEYLHLIKTEFENSDAETQRVLFLGWTIAFQLEATKEAMTKQLQHIFEESVKIKDGEIELETVGEILKES